MIVYNRSCIGIQNKELDYLYLRWEERFSFKTSYHETLDKERGNVFLAPNQLVEWS